MGGIGILLTQLIVQNWPVWSDILVFITSTLWSISVQTQLIEVSEVGVILVGGRSSLGMLCLLRIPLIWV